MIELIKKIDFTLLVNFLKLYLTCNKPLDLVHKNQVKWKKMEIILEIIPLRCYLKRNWKQLWWSAIQAMIHS